MTTLEKYLSEMSGLRGSLERGFEEQESWMDSVQKRTSKRDYANAKYESSAPPPWIEFPDLSHLNPPRRSSPQNTPRKRPEYTPHPDTIARPGEMFIGDWLVKEGAKLGLSGPAIRHRLKRGDYPHLKLRRVNARVVFVIL